MPQNNPMTPEDDITIELPTPFGPMKVTGKSRESHDAQLIRATLEEAVERVCSNCKKSLSACNETCVGEKECFIKLSILEPLTKEK
jgi:hypothetical protein